MALRGSAGAGPRVQLGSWSPGSCRGRCGDGTAAALGFVRSTRPVATDPLLAMSGAVCVQLGSGSSCWGFQSPSPSQQGEQQLPQALWSPDWSPLIQAMRGHLRLTLVPAELRRCSQALRLPPAHPWALQPGFYLVGPLSQPFGGPWGPHTAGNGSQRCEHQLCLAAVCQEAELCQGCHQGLCRCALALLAPPGAAG